MFEVRGLPQPKGSTKAFAFMDKKTGRPRAVVTGDCKGTKPWAGDVRIAAKQNAPTDGPWQGPITLSLAFRVQAPQSLPKTRRSFAVKKPDLDKLTRAVKDALTGVIYRDDSQVVEMLLTKQYGEVPGVSVVASQTDEQSSLSYQPKKKERACRRK